MMEPELEAALQSSSPMDAQCEARNSGVRRRVQSSNETVFEWEALFLLAAICGFGMSLGVSTKRRETKAADQ